MPPVPDRIVVGSKVVNLRDQRVEGEVLSDQDCRLLAALASREGGVVSKETLYREVWGYQRMPRGRALDFAIRRLRERLEEDPSAATALLTERGRGFRLRWSPAAAPGPAAVGHPRFSGNWVGPEGQRSRLQRRLEDPTGPVVVHGPPGVGRRRWIAEALGNTPSVDWVETRGESLEALQTALAAATARAQQSPGTRSLVLCGVVHASVLRAWLREADVSAWARVVVSSPRRLGARGEVAVAAAPLGDADARALLVDHLDALGIPLPSGAALDPLLSLLDGLPLAILLVAPHLRVLSLKQLVERIPSDPALLEDPQGERSLRAKVQDAVADLGAEAQAALTLLARFPKGLALSTAEALLGDGALVMLAGLGDLGVLSASAREEGRVRVLGPIALGIRAELVASSEPLGSAVVAAHLEAVSASPQAEVAQPAKEGLRAFLRQEHHQAEAWVEALGGQVSAETRGGWVLAFAQVAGWLGKMDAKEALLDWGCGLGLGPVPTAGLLFELVAMLAVQSRTDDAWQRCRALEALAPEPAVLAWTARSRAVLHRSLLAFDEALLELDAAEAAVWSARDRGALAAARHDLLAISGQPGLAAALLEVIRASATAADDDELRIMAGVRSAFHAFRSGDHTEATATCRRLLPLARRLQHAEGEASLHRRLALYLTEAGEFEAARRSRKAALRRTDPDLHPGTYARLLSREAEYLEQKGDLEEAGRMALEACTRARAAGGLGPLLVALRVLVVLGLGSDPYPYDSELDELETLSVDSEEVLHSVTICFVRGMLASRQGEEGLARRLLSKGLQQADGAEQILEGSMMLMQMGCLAAHVGDGDTARACLARLEKAYSGETWGIRVQDNRWYRHTQAVLGAV